MILSSHGIIGSSSQGLPPDYQDILDYATAQGYTLPSIGQQSLQEQLLNDLFSAGIWDKLDTFAVFATDGDSDFALIDWKRLTQYTAVNSPTFTTNVGFTGDGTSSYLNTNFSPSTDGVNYTSTDASFGLYYDKLIDTSSSYVAGVREGVDINANYLRTFSLSTNSINSNDSSNRRSYTQNYDFKQLQLIGGNEYLYGDGNQDGSFAFVGTAGSATIPFFLLCFNNNGTPAFYSTTNIRSFYAGSSLLSESNDFNTALTTYYNAL